jgi:protein required for attachment to host cells
MNVLETWILVADKSRGRFFCCDSPRGPLHELEDYVCPGSRLHGNQRFTDGRSRTHIKDHEHHTFPPPEPDQDPEVVDFARELARRADVGRQQGDFGRLILVAAADFLGALRKALSPSTAKLVTRTIDSNFTHLNASDIRHHLPEII